MAGRHECEHVEGLMRDGRHEEAFLAAMEIVTRDHGDPTGQLFDIIEKCAETIPSAALASALSYRMFDRPEGRPGTISTFFELAIAGDDETIRNLATFRYGMFLLRSPDTERRGVRLVRIASKAGVADATAELGEILQNGLHGQNVDLDACLKCYIEAVEGGSGSGMYQLAQFMLDHQVRVGEYHPLELMKDSAQRGHPLAIQFVRHAMKFADRMPEDEDDEEDMLPYAVVPDGLERITLVREALRNEFDMCVEHAGQITAALHGYPTWELMSEAAVDPVRAKGRFDEECSAVEFNDRERMQVEIFTKVTGAQPDVALTSIKLLKPTARRGRPSLRKLNKSVDDQIFKGMSGELGEMLGNVLGQMGMAGGVKTGDAFRTIWPLQASLWLDVLRSHGWNLRRCRDNVSEDGGLICVAETDDGRLFKVFLSACSYVPGDLGDELVEERMKTISRTCDKAVLVFNHPQVHPVRNSETQALFFGGRILNNGEWWDFLIRRQGGIEDALRQHCLFEQGISQTVVDQFAFEGAVALACRIAAKVTDQQSAEGFGLIGDASGWCSPVPPAAIAAARLMRTIGSIDS